ncbi:hypothetical protein KAFR_0G03080 [Kazachstania africana CBS 2517]|uniref:DH domain-containing protein n=1 Tax=Kazachstania africana (strain ATCC 22294 / BCRC 22015 / CBS 2517 / CECT 1963 / NBRC 1671 / NRRL Y-8276) TaxID=1071382 RepID=H2AY90_KAZAF|nr:hypothetical protein KAFR_0G03080 [Kazachstania africana CBS 2517]CCF59340.1 hypothetical protein KAFR_0G03080 [Kazachstania africana CBS 2517]
MVNVSVNDFRKRYNIYSEIFGNERLHDTFPGQNTDAFVSDRIEDLKHLDSLIDTEDITNDIIHADQESPKVTMAKEFILSQRTSIKNVADTQSLSSADNTSVGSPKKQSTIENPVTHSRSHSQTSSSSASTSTRQSSGNATIQSAFASKSTNYRPPQPNQDVESQKTKNSNNGTFIPKRKPSLPQLAIAGLKKQPSFSSASNTPTQSTSRKSPLQGFGLFSRSSSKDLTEHLSNQAPTATSPKLSQGAARRSSSLLSLNASTLKNLTSSLQSRSSHDNTITTIAINSNTSRKTSSAEANSTQAFYRQYASTKSSQTLNYADLHASSSHNSNINDPVGLGIQTRSSSASLATKRYTSGSSTSFSTFHNSHNFHTQSHHHSRRNSMTPSTTPSSKRMTRTSSRKSAIYPALLSRIATKFKAKIQLGEYKKDGILYRDSFSGKHAVDVICAIIRNPDRNIALLLGRSLDAQKLFHDVVYEHRLRDSPNEIYEFTDNSRFIGPGNTGPMRISSQDPLLLLSNSSKQNLEYSDQLVSSTSTSSLSSGQTLTRENQHLEEENKEVTPLHNVNGIFTLLAECYSPTCSRDKLCYSISCPRRLEQQARLNIKPNGGLKRNISMALEDDEVEKPSWTSSVSESVWKNLSKKEIKRQEAIYEVFTTEKNFVKSLETIRDTFMRTLSETNIIPVDIRKNFNKHVFAHIMDIYSVNRRFLEVLSDRQKSSPVVRGIGDILLRFIPFFEPFVSYVASRPYAKYLIETQRSVNPYFARFDDDMMNSSLRHGIDSFLSQGVSRPGRYMLLVKELIKSTDEEKDKRDLEYLNKAMDALRHFMKRIDKASGAAQDRHDVKLLKQKILFKNEYVNMGLNDEKRKIKHEGVLSRKELSKADNTTAGDIQFYLLDNMLLFLKAKSVNKWHQHKVFQRPIPLPLLFACPSEDMPALRKYIGGQPDSSGTIIQPEYNYSNTRNAITFLYYGAKQRYQITLYAAQIATLQTLLDKVRVEQQRIINETDMINVTKISDKFFDYSNKINSVTSCDGGRKLLIATNSGLYMSNIKRQEINTANNKKKPSISFSIPIQLVHRSNILQIAVLDEFQTIILLVDKKLYSVPLQLLQADNSNTGTSYFKKHSKELINHVNFFSEGDCNGKRLIVTAHSSSHSIKFFELEHPLLSNNINNNTNKKNIKRKITEVTFDSEPVSISFLKANLCIGCKKGFQIVSISQNAHESLLDPADTSLEFALRDTLKPMAIYRVGNMFLLCYAEFAFFVNNQGWRKKESHIIHWEGEPQKFAIWYPYILAFDSNFIEIRKIDTGELVRCILGDKIRLLQTNTQEVLYAYEDSRGYDTVASLDFWG